MAFDVHPSDISLTLRSALMLQILYCNLRQLTGNR